MTASVVVVLGDEPGDESGDGWALRPAVLPVALRRADMVVAARGRTGEPIPVAPGAYLATTTVPGGAELVAPVEVGDGEARTVRLDAAPTPSAPTPSAPTGADPPATVRTVHLRLLAGDPFTPPLTTVGAARLALPGGVLEREDGLPALPADPGPDPHPFRIRLTLPDGGGAPVFWLRVDAPPESVLVTAVPALPGGGCTVELSRSAGRDRIVVDLRLDDPALDALVHYRQAGDARQARVLLDGGVAGPAGSGLGAVVAAYAALRLGSDVTPPSPAGTPAADLPDVHVCAAERLARRGEHSRARAEFVVAARAGLPMFGNGLGYLTSRIPQYLRSAPDGDPELAGLWHRLGPFVRAADLKQSVLCLRDDVLAFE